MELTPITFTIFTVSDSCYRDGNEDKTGPALEKCVLESFPHARIFHKDILPDESDIIQNALCEFADKRCNVILTAGGTGLSSRDVTPESTMLAIDKEATGISHVMRAKSLQVTEMAMLSRAIAGIKDQTLIINLPGSPKAACECFGFVKSALVHAVQLLTDQQEAVQETHRRLQNTTGSKVRIDQVAMRNRNSPYQMLEVENALKLVVENCKAREEIEPILIEHALNRILAEVVYALEPFPPFCASIKDGYAVITEDGIGVRTVRDAMAAGDYITAKELENGEVIRINTGAAVPVGADAVVQVEDTELVLADRSNKEVKIKINVAPALGQDIRKIGSDIQEGELLLSKNHKLNAALIGVLATIGRTSVFVYKRPNVGVLSTGNELQRHHEQLRPGHVRDSNKLTLLNLLKEHGYDGFDCGIARDDPDSVKQAFINAFERCDVVVSSGGVSMGEFDLIKEVLRRDFNAVIHFGRLNMKPGKPTTFATCTFNQKRKFIFALPGNPVSAMVTTLLFVIPALRSLEKQTPYKLPHISVVMGEDVKLDPRPEYRRVRLQKAYGQHNIYEAFSTGDQISSRLNSFVGAHALALIPSIANHKSNVLKRGSAVEALLLDLNF